MKKGFLVFFIASVLSSPTFAGNHPSGTDKASPATAVQAPEKECVSAPDDRTKPNGRDEQTESGKTKASMEATSESQKPGRKGFPSFREKPWLYIGSGVLMIVIITVYLVFGSGGYSSR